jgi:SAM-dependent methyltransferase
MRYAELEYLKAPGFVSRFGNISLIDQRVLDFGCRFGGSSLWYAEHGASNVIGIDVDQGMIDIAADFIRSRRFNGAGCDGNIDLRIGGPKKVPVEDQSIDLILCEDVVRRSSANGIESSFQAERFYAVLARFGIILMAFIFGQSFPRHGLIFCFLNALYARPGIF